MKRDLGTGIDVFLVTGYLGHGGGAERQVAELAVRLDRNRYVPVVVCLVPDRVANRHGGHYYSRLLEARVEVITIRRHGRIGAVQLLNLARLVRARRPAIVHSFSFSPNWRARVACLLSPWTRLVASERTLPTWKSWGHHALDRVLARRTDAIIANAEAIRATLVELGNIREAKIRVIHNGIDTEIFRPDRDRDAIRRSFGWRDNFVMGHVGSMAPHKGQAAVVEVGARLVAQIPNLRMVLVGDGPEREAVLERARHLNVSGFLELPGFVSDVAVRLAGMDVYVHLSQIREGCSNAILEAMSCGVPVIASDVGGNRELVVHGETGFLVPEWDTIAAFDHVLRLAGDPALRARLSDAATRHVRLRFGVDRMVEWTSRLYDEILAPRVNGTGP